MNERSRLLLPTRRKLLKAAAAALFVPAAPAIVHAYARGGASMGKSTGGGGGGGGGTPAAVAGTGWVQAKNWNFGTAAGNNIQSLPQWASAGWACVGGHQNNASNECEYFNFDLTSGNQNVQFYSDHAAIVATWNGGTIQPANGPTGSIYSEQITYPTDSLGITVPFGYYEITAKVPSVTGMWPAWWCVGRVPGSPQGSFTWGPEVDIFELYDTNTNLDTVSLHSSQGNSDCKSGDPCTYNFVTTGGDPLGIPLTPYTTYSPTTWQMGELVYQPPATDFSQAYHTYGMKIDTNYNISIWIDNTDIGYFQSNTFADDTGNKVVPMMLLDLAIKTPAGSINTANFGGVNNTNDGTNPGPVNLFNLKFKNIQFWVP